MLRGMKPTPPTKHLQANVQDSTLICGRKRPFSPNHHRKIFPKQANEKINVSNGLTCINRSCIIYVSWYIYNNSIAAISGDSIYVIAKALFNTKVISVQNKI